MKQLVGLQGEAPKHVISMQYFGCNLLEAPWSGTWLDITNGSWVAPKSWCPRIFFYEMCLMLLPVHVPPIGKGLVGPVYEGGPRG